VLAVVSLFGLAGCGSDDDAADTAQETTTTTEAPKATEIAVTYDGKKIVAPDKAEAGLVQFKLTSTADEKAQGNILLGKVDAGKTLADIAAEIKTDKGAPPTWYKVTGSVDFRATKARTLTVVLDEGMWALVAPPEGDASGISAVINVGPAMAGSTAKALPATEVSLGATEYTFDVKGLKAGPNRITLKNNGGLPHMFGLFQLKGDAKLDDVLAYEGEDEPEGLGEFQDNLSYMDPGRSAVVETTIPPGRYGLVCFLDAAPGGKTDKPHFMLGMKQELTIS
jgi:hypothetical protein